MHPGDRIKQRRKRPSLLISRICRQMIGLQTSEPEVLLTLLPGD